MYTIFIVFAVVIVLMVLSVECFRRWFRYHQRLWAVPGFLLPCAASVAAAWILGEGLQIPLSGAIVIFVMVFFMLEGSAMVLGYSRARSGTNIHP